MVDFCLTCSVANFESFGRECKSGVRIQDGCDLQSLPILPKQECILGHWFLCQVLRVVRERVSIQDWWCNLLSLPKQVCILGHWFLLQVFESYESVSVQDRWHLHLPKQECILGHWFLLQVFGSYESVSVQDRWHLQLPKQECILGHWFLLQVLRVMRV